MSRRAVVAATVTAAIIAFPQVTADEPPWLLAHGDTRLHRTARCESGFGGEHRPKTNTGNGHYGAYQFTLRSWRWVGGKGYPHKATMRVQTRMARRLRDRQGGANAWPYCWPHNREYRYI